MVVLVEQLGPGQIFDVVAQVKVNVVVVTEFLNQVPVI